MKKRNWRIGSFIAILLMVLTGWKMNVAAAGTVTIFLDQKTLNVEDTLRVTVQTSEPEDDAIPPEVTLTYDNNLLEFKYCSEEYGGGEGGLITLSSATANLSFVAKKAGSASLSAEAVIDGDGNNKATANRSVSITGTGALDTEQKNDSDKNDEQETTDNDEKEEQTDENAEEDETKEISSNANLKKFKVSEAKIKPKFSSDVTEYTVTLKTDVKQLLFTAKTQDSNAKILAASGFSNLKNGNNRAVLTVEAEDGTKKTYTFTIIKEGKAASTEDTNQREVAEEVNGYIAVEDGDLCVNTTFPEEMVPEGFKKINYVYKEQIVEAAYSEMGAMILLYLTTADGSMGDFYIYYSGTDEFMDFIQLKGAEGHFIFPIQFPVGIVIPDGFQDSALAWNDKTVPAFMVAMNSEEVDDSVEEGNSQDGTQDINSPDTETQTEELEMAKLYAQPEDFYLVYAMNQDGGEGFYLYDSLEGTYQRYLDMSYVSLDNDTFDGESYVIFKQKSQKRMVVIGILIVAVVVMSFLILNMFLKIRELEQGLEDDEQEDDEQDDHENDDKKQQAQQEKKNALVKRSDKKEKLPNVKPVKETKEVKREKKQKEKKEIKSAVKVQEKAEKSVEIAEASSVEKKSEVVQKRMETKRPGPVMFDLTTPKVDGNLSPKKQREQLGDDFEFEFINIDE